MIQNFIQNLAEGLGQWAYLLVAFLAAAETAAFLGFIAPGEFGVLFGGVLAGEGTLSVELLIGIVWAAAVLGDSIGFMLGKRLGRDFVVRHGPRVRLTEDRLKKVEAYFDRHGGKTILLGRWIGFVRPLMPFTAGASGLPYRRFLPYDVLSAGAWSTTFILLGYFFWQSFTQITSIASKGALALGIVVVLIVGGYQAAKRLRNPEQRRRFAAWVDRQAQKPMLRPIAIVGRVTWRLVLHPLWRLIAPPLRFTIARLSPGDLGIELTTLMAVAAVSIYIIALQVNLIETGDYLITGDQGALEVVRNMENGMLTALAKALSFLGTFWVVLLAVVATSAYFLMQRRFAEVAVLVAGMGLTTIAFHVLKASVDRPRPLDPLVDSSGSAYPSGHAALAVTYLAIAVLLARAGPATRRVAVLMTGLTLTVLIGLSRVYLRVHWLSDVGGGWATGLAVFSICGSVALVIHYLRNNVGGTQPVDVRQ